MRHGIANIAAIIFLAVSALPAAAGDLTGRYLYTLSDFSGPESLSWVQVHSAGAEAFVLNPSDQNVHIFDSNGMEVYRFAVDQSLGSVTDLAVADTGDIYLLVNRAGAVALVHCNYRGEVQGSVTLKGLPAEYGTGFAPTALAWQGGRLFLADRQSMRVALVDGQGNFTGGYDLGDIIGMDLKKRADAPMAGFSVDRSGNMLFTIPTSFAAYVVSPDRKVRSFGVKGSTPGKFNVISGIAANERGDLFIIDALRCVVMVFDKDFTFRSEFGYRGLQPENLITPRDLALQGDMVYVTQGRGRGVNVYRVIHTDGDPQV